MYVPANGMGAFRRKRLRRGLGLNCPGDPGCPGYVEPGSEAYQTSLLQAILSNQADATGGTQTVYYTPSPSPGSQWITGIPNWVVGVAGGTFGLLMLTKAMR
jgi:hypothetical protein